jgi:SAM-dependent methyltransferase
MISQRNDRVIFKSKPLDGIMAPEYFELATPDHFWCRRRFAVLESLAGDILRNAAHLAEIGCGNGVLMHQIEEKYHRPVIGFDLHEGALRKSISQSGAVYCYDIHDRDREFEQKFDVVLMFDVLEHIENEDRFLESTQFHMTPGGYLLVNVPALQWLYSPYDRIQGHCRRYSIRNFESVAQRNGFEVIKASYWGAPLVPVAAIRKLLLSLRKTQEATYAKGFDPGSPVVNNLLMNASRFEVVPQHLIGTSVMAVLRMLRNRN